MTRTEPPKAAGPAFGGPGQRRSLVGAGLFSLYLKRYLDMSKDIVAKLKKLAGGKAEDDTPAVATAPTLAVGTGKTVAQAGRPKPQWLADMEAEEAAEAADHDQAEDEEEVDEEEVGYSFDETDEEDEEESEEPGVPAVTADIDIDALAEKVAAKVLLHLANAIRHLPL